MTKVSSEAINQRMTDNTIAKRKRTKGQTKIHKTFHRKLKIPTTRTPLEFGMNSCAAEG
jgi:hypothetical protein